MIETRHLQYFLAVAREGSFTHAASSLHVSQPTLSKQIADLEKQLGKQLLVRGGKGVELTEEGVYLRTRAAEMLEIMEQTEAELKSDEGALSGDIYFGCGETAIMDVIVGEFDRLRAGNPDVRIHFFSGDAETVLERIDKGLLDAGLLLGPEMHEKYDYVPLGMYDTFGLLMNADDPLAQKDVVTIDDLKELPLILPQQSSNSRRIIRWFEEHDVEIKSAASYNLIYNAIFLVEHGLGYALTLENLVETGGSRKLAFRRLEPSMQIEAFIVSKRFQARSKAAKAFLERLEKLS